MDRSRAALGRRRRRVPGARLRAEPVGTNRPIFSDRDGQVRYALSEIGEERRTGYLWYTDEPATTLRRYDRWAARLRR